MSLTKRRRVVNQILGELRAIRSDLRDVRAELHSLSTRETPDLVRPSIIGSAFAHEVYQAQRLRALDDDEIDSALEEARAVADWAEERKDHKR